MTHHNSDDNFFPFGRDLSAGLKEDLRNNIPHSSVIAYEDICISAWYGQGTNGPQIEIAVSDFPSCITNAISLIELLETQFKNSCMGGTRKEKIAFESLRDCINRLIAIREQELADFPFLSDDEWPETVKGILES